MIILCANKIFIAFQEKIRSSYAPVYFQDFQSQTFTVQCVSTSPLEFDAYDAAKHIQLMNMYNTKCY